MAPDEEIALTVRNLQLTHNNVWKIEKNKKVTKYLPSSQAFHYAASTLGVLCRPFQTLPEVLRAPPVKKNDKFVKSYSYFD